MANVFPRWFNQAPIKLGIIIFVIGVFTVSGITYYWGPSYTRVGYQPTQPVAYDHSLHVNQLGMDCRYCHSFVDQSAHANIPDAATCMNCHNAVRPDSPALAPIRASYESGQPVQWVRIHKLPDYVYFNHSVHVNRGVSCVECHGQINQMEKVWHDKPLNMSFCLDCHRNPEEFIRPNEEVFNLDWKASSPEEQINMGTTFVHNWKVNPPQSCSGCHR